MKISSSARRRRVAANSREHLGQAQEALTYLDSLIEDIFTALVPYPDALAAATAAAEARVADRPSGLRGADHG